jgi:hypothetical protein
MTRLVLAAAVAGAASAVVLASDPIAVYARIDRVVVEPSGAAPQRIQVWGVFSIAERSNPNTYLPPARGYLYFTVPAAEREAALARAEWNDLQQVAGTPQIVAFGNRYQLHVRLRKADERPEAPDTYVLNVGIRKVRADTDYAPIRSLAERLP